MSKTTPIRILTSIAVVGLGLASLTGCTLINTLAGGGGSTPTPTAEPTASETATESPTPSETTDPTTPAPTEAGQLTNFFDLKVGDCFDVPDDANGNALLFSSCNVLHDYEAYSVETMPGDSTYPGETAVDDFASTACVDAFQAYVGKPYSSSTYAYTPITPSKETWEQLNDREILCVLGLADGTPTTGSAKDSRK